MTIYATPGPGAGDWVIIGVAIVCAAAIATWYGTLPSGLMCIKAAGVE